MYYRGSGHTYGDAEADWHPEVYCYAESDDGVEWRKPSLGLVEFEGSTDNNIILDEKPATHNFTPFKDANPECGPDEAYKGVGGGKEGLIAYKSSDGVRWTRMADEPIITDGYFDSQNLVFWGRLPRRVPRVPQGLPRHGLPGAGHQDRHVGGLHELARPGVDRPTRPAGSASCTPTAWSRTTGRRTSSSASRRGTSTGAGPSRPTTCPRSSTGASGEAGRRGRARPSRTACSCPAGTASTSTSGRSLS